MIIQEKRNKYSIDIIYISVFTYFMHTRVDIEFNNIIFFANESDGTLMRYTISEFKDSDLFCDLIGKIKKEKVDYCNVEKCNVNIYYTEHDYLFIDKSAMNLKIKYHLNQFEIEFNNEDFNIKQKSNFKKYFIKLIDFVNNNLQYKVNDYNILSELEIINMVKLYDYTKKDYDINMNVVSNFYKYLNSSPDDPCVIFKNSIFSYKNIEFDSYNIARLLKEVSSNKVGIVLFMDRGPKIISSILAVLKINCFYVPVDISTPIERLDAILVDSKVKIVLVDDTAVEILVAHNYFSDKIIFINVDKVEVREDYIPIMPISNPDDLCYVIYTSGSTGNPKGISIKNKNIANFICNNIFTEYIENITNPCIIAANKVGFDAFVADTLLPLVLGIKIVMSSNEELTIPKLFVKSIRDNNVNIIQTTPTRLVFSIVNHEPDVLENFKIIACGGEPFLKSLIDTIRSKTSATILNVYGPTETTIWSTYSVVSNYEKGIGKPISNTKCFILNRFNKIMPKYEIGILFLSGAGLGSYLSDDKLQQEKFVMIKDIEETIYNTGDTAYISCDNFVIYDSRIDTQVKINGVRIELQEIESVAIKSGLLKECVVVDRPIENFGHKLVLYYTSPHIINESELKIYLRNKLPNTYIPNFVVKVTDMPLTSSNKINRNALPIPKINKNIELGRANTKTEKLIINYLKLNYGVEFDIKTTFEEIGIDSLGVFTLLTKIDEISDNFNIDKFRYSMTVEELAYDIDFTFKEQLIPLSYPENFFKDYSQLFEYNNLNKKSILLTGASGFLGVHVLNNLLNDTSLKIVCLCHKHQNLEEIYKLNYRLKNYDPKRIEIIIGDIGKKNLGLTKKDSYKLDNISEIIHCAAIVKYFGDEEIFFNVNVLSVRNLSEFAVKKGIVLNHISTLSVLGKNNYTCLSEKHFWHKQFEILKNQYTKSKMNAELEIYNKAKVGLKFRIIRVGRLTWRYTDKVFQSNPENNEFYSSLMLFKEMKKVPNNLKDIEIEISPIDFCAKAVMKIVSQSSINGIFHVMNDNSIKLSFIIDSMNSLGAKIDWVEESEFMKEFLIRNDKLSLRNQICINSDNKYEIESNPMISNILTKNILNNVNFSWPIITQDYFSYLIDKKDI